MGQAERANNILLELLFFASMVLLASMTKLPLVGSSWSCRTIKGVIIVGVSGPGANGRPVRTFGTKVMRNCVPAGHRARAGRGLDFRASIEPLVQR